MHNVYCRLCHWMHALLPHMLLAMAESVVLFIVLFIATRPLSLYLFCCCSVVDIWFTCNDVIPCCVWQATRRKRRALRASSRCVLVTWPRVITGYSRTTRYSRRLTASALVDRAARPMNLTSTAISVTAVTYLRPHSIILASCKPGFRLAWACRKYVASRSKACRKHVANPHELVKNLAANLVESQVCSQVCSLLE